MLGESAYIGDSREVSSPLGIYKSRRKIFYLNFNNVLKLHYKVYNKVKIAYTDIMYSQLTELPIFNKVRVVYTLYPRDNKLCDLGNVCSIHQKFFEDALVHYGRLPDDNYKFIPITLFKFGYVDREFPRVDIIIEEIE